jgi:Putative zinc- or iron-chelating domain
MITQPSATLHNPPPDPPAALNPILPEEGPTFQCNGCGHCCTTWQVFVDAQRGDHLLAQPWVAERLAQHSVSFEPVPGPKGNKGYYLPLTATRECVFLGEDLRCLVDIHEGPGAKPNDCQRFPFAAVPTPNDQPTLYDTTAACQTVASKLLLAFSPIQPGATEAQAVADYVANPATLGAFGNPVPLFGPTIRRYPWPLGAWRRLSVADYELKVAVLQHHFKTTFAHPVELLKWVRSVIHNDNHQLPEPIITARTNWPSCKLWLLLAMVLRRPYGMFSLWQWAITRHYHDPKLLGSGVTLPVDKIRAVTWPTDVGSVQCRAFLYALLRRRIALSYGSSWSTQLSVTIAAWALVDWYTKVFAALNEQSEVGLDEVILGIRTVERYYTGHQPRFQGLFDWNPWYGWLFAWLL